MADTGELYKYERLPEGSYIRLVELLPELSETGSLSCLLHEVPFGTNETPPYETLSYCWGQATTLESIACNGKSLLITHTLHRALQELRNSDQSRTIWIDQICINQKNDEEKTSQVLMMREIYSRSTSTTAWLGEATNATEEALSAVSRISRAGAHALRDGTLSRAFEGKPNNEMLQTLMTDRSTDWGDLRPTQREIIQIGILLDSPWFQRMWIIQECTLSKEVSLLCGSNSLDFEHLMLALCLMFMTALATRKFYNANYVRVMFLSGLRQLPHTDARLQLVPLLEASQEFEASDIRDKFYALYGLTSTDTLALGLRPDYALPADWVYMQTVYRLSQDLGTLRLLEMVDHRSDMDDTWPSWVPRLHAGRQSAQLLISDDSAIRNCAVDSAISDMVKSMVKSMAEKEAQEDDSMDEDERIAFVEAFMKEWHGTASGDDAPDAATDAQGGDLLGDIALPHVAASKGVPLTTFALGADGTLKVAGQLVDKVQQLSDVVEPRFSDLGRLYTSMDSLESQDEDDESVLGVAAAVASGFKAFGGWVGTTYRKAKEYAAALTERDEMVMARKDIPYPNGDPLMTAYRVTLTAGSIEHEVRDPDRLFQEWRKLFRPAHAVSRLFKSVGLKGNPAGMDLLGLVAGGQAVSAETRVFFAKTEVSYGRRLVWTQKGYLALVPGATVEGDLIVIIAGGRVPFVLRPRDHGYCLIGPAYVHGMMKGELFDEEACGEIRLV